MARIYPATSCDLHNYFLQTCDNEMVWMKQGEVKERRLVKSDPLFFIEDKYFCTEEPSPT